MDELLFTGKDGSFSLRYAENTSGLLFPVANEKGLKSLVTPNLGGGTLYKNREIFLNPLTLEKLKDTVESRNFWIYVENKGAWSATGMSSEHTSCKFTNKQDYSEVDAGLMWHTVKRISDIYGLKAEITSFVPPDDNVEVMHVRLENRLDQSQGITPFFAVPFSESTSSDFKEICTNDYGIMVHQSKGNILAFVMGIEEDGEKPESFFTTVHSFAGEGGLLTHPRSIYRQEKGTAAGTKTNAPDPLGGIRFEPREIFGGEAIDYIILLGAAKCGKDIEKLLQKYSKKEEVTGSLMKTKEYWQHRYRFRLHTGNSDFDQLMIWCDFQTILSEIFSDQITGNVKHDTNEQDGTDEGAKARYTDQFGNVYVESAVKYSEALYTRGLVEEGSRILRNLAGAALDFRKSRIYPGIPDVFRQDGRGYLDYHFCAANAYAKAVISSVYGINEQVGGIRITPRPTDNDLDKNGEASVDYCYNGRTISVEYKNPRHKKFGDYRIKKVMVNDKTINVENESVLIEKKQLESFSDNEKVKISIVLG